VGDYAIDYGYLTLTLSIPHISEREGELDDKVIDYVIDFLYFFLLHNKR
jgi:hypothetical protein